MTRISAADREGISSPYIEDKEVAIVLPAPENPCMFRVPDCYDTVVLEAKVMWGPTKSKTMGSWFSTNDENTSQWDYVKFFTDTPVGESPQPESSRWERLPHTSRDRKYWPVYCCVLAILPAKKGHIHILGRETANDELIVVSDYNYKSRRHGKIVVLANKAWQRPGWKKAFGNGYPPKIEVGPSQLLQVSFTEDIPTAYLTDALRFRGYELGVYQDGIDVPGVLVAAQIAGKGPRFMVDNWDPNREPLSEDHPVTIKAGTKILAFKL